MKESVRNMYYEEDFVDEVRSRNDIVDVISTYVNLKRSGSNYVGLCPFHNEKQHPFLSVPASRCTTVSAVERVEMYLLF